MPAVMTILNPTLDEDSDENLSLDLHMSDNDDSEGTTVKPVDEEIPMDVEDEILDKFDTKEKPSKEANTEEKTADEHATDLDETVVAEGEKKTDDDDEVELNGETDDVTSDTEVETTAKTSEDDTHVETTESTDEKCEDTDEKYEDSDDKCEDTDEKCEDIDEKCDDADEKCEDTDEKCEDADDKCEDTDEKIEDTLQEEPPKEPDDSSKDSSSDETKPDDDIAKKTDDEGECDLLLVMDEKTTDADETEFTSAAAEEDETSGSEEAKGDKDETLTPPDEPSEDNTDSNQDDNMDIEETGIDGTIELTENILNSTTSDADDTLNTTVIENVPVVKDDDDDVMVVSNDSNKENVAVNAGEVGGETTVSVLQTILQTSTSAANTDIGKAPVKRQLSDGDSDDGESKKKIKLVEEPVLKKLAGFKQYMVDKSLKNLTREQLEVFCIQKMCECIVQKSEIGELKMKIKNHEQLLDVLRKEAVLLSKQTRDLNIVHQKVLQDVARIKENSDKPLIVPKITRSVGLQAIVREDNRRRISKATVPQSPVKPATPQKVMPKSPVVTSPVVNRTVTPQNNRYGNKKVIPTVPSLVRAKMPVNGTTPPKKPEAANKGSGVIDLTDEDDKKATAVSTTTATATTGSNVVKVNAPNNHKFVVLPSGQTMLVKLTEMEDPAARKRRLSRERQIRWRAKQSPESSFKIRIRNNLAVAIHRAKQNNDLQASSDVATDEESPQIEEVLIPAIKEESEEETTTNLIKTDSVIKQEMENQFPIIKAILSKSNLTEDTQMPTIKLEKEDSKIPVITRIDKKHQLPVLIKYQKKKHVDSPQMPKLTRIIKQNPPETIVNHQQILVSQEENKEVMEVIPNDNVAEEVQPPTILNFKQLVASQNDVQHIKKQQEIPVITKTSTEKETHKLRILQQSKLAELLQKDTIVWKRPKLNVKSISGSAVGEDAANNSVVVSQPVIRAGQPQNGAIRSPMPVLRGGPGAPVRSPLGGPRGRSPGQGMVRARATYSPQQAISKKHPAPLPLSPSLKTNVFSKKPVPPKPQLMLNKTACGTGIVLSWKMPYKLEVFEEIASYQLYAYQETKMEPRTDSWGKIGDVKALELPMAVTLTQFAVGNRYYFAVRAVDVLTRHGVFSDYQTILL